MAERAIELLADPDKRRRMGARGREWAVQQYNTERVIPQYIELYQRVLHKANGRTV